MEQTQETIRLFSQPDGAEGGTCQKTNSVCVREVTYDTGRGGEPVEIVQLADIHFNKINIQDMIEHNPSVMSTFNARGMRAYGMSVVNLGPCLDFAACADQLVVTGDTLDYLTHGALEMLDTHIWRRFPDALVALGNHDTVRTMGLEGSIEDPTPREENYAMLQKHWRHDVLYTARVLKDKVTVIQLDNSQNGFWDSQIAPLTQDIAEARANGRIVLLFMHIPLCSRNPAEHPLRALDLNGAHDELELYEGEVGWQAQGASAAVYDLIVNNADVVRGVFCGHRHAGMSSQILAKTTDGEMAVIPQIIVNGVYAAPYVIKITVK